MHALTTQASLRSHQDRLRRLVRSGIRAAWPLFTYKEFLRLVRSEYHAFVCELRETATWDEITALTGMTRAGLNKLGDVIPPTSHANAVRVVLSLVQRHGPDGLTMGELAGAFYEEYPSLDGPDLRQAVASLVEAGLVEHRATRVVAVANELDYSAERVLDIARTTAQIADRLVAEDAEGPERMLRFTFAAPNDPARIEALHQDVAAAMLRIAEQAEAEAAQAPGTRTMTLVYAGAPDAP